MVDGVQNNRESATKFLDSVNTALDGKDAKDRATELQYLVAKLEKEGKLPNLILNAGMGDSESTNFRATTFNGKEIRKDEIKSISETGKNGPMKYDAATQLIASALTRKFDQIDKQSTDAHGRWNGNKADSKLSTNEINKWAGEETRTGVRLPCDTVKSPIKQYENVLKNFGTPEQLRSAFGTDTPSLEQIKKAVDHQTTKRQTLGSLGLDDAALKSAHEKGGVWSDEKMSAAQYLANSENYDRIQGSVDESYKPFSSGDWLSAAKIKEVGNSTFKTSLEQIAAKEKASGSVSKEVADLGAKLDAKLKPNADAAKPAAEQPAATEEEAKLRKENQELKLKQQETEERLKRMEAMLQALASGEKPPVQAEKPQQEVKPPTQEVKPPTQEVKPPTQEVKPPTEAAKPPQQQNWAEEEERMRKELEALFNKK
jgi:hypothetical protein